MRVALKPRRRRNLVGGCVLACLSLHFGFFPVATDAHTPSETYFTLKLDRTNLTGRWDVALRDLHQAMGLTPEVVKSMAPEALQPREEAMVLDVAAGVKLRADGRPLSLTITDYTTLPLNGIEYARLIFNGSEILAAPNVIEIDTSAAFRIDTNMHGLLRLEHDGRTEVLAFNQQRAAHRFELGQSRGRWARWLTFIWEGVWHIWIGLDHVLFLMALLLPAVLKREGNRWVGAERFREALINVVKIVTAFTIAHSVTLTLSVLGIVSLPTRLVESVIAASVVMAALNNLYAILSHKAWLVALGFGLIHGFGFANVLIDLELAGGSLAMALAGFNVGVEAGQLMLVIIFLPVAFFIRDSWFYRTIALKFGSAVVILLATGWMIERLLDRQLMPF